MLDTGAESEPSVLAWLHAAVPAAATRDLPPGTLHKFVETLAKQITARSSGNPDDYLALADREGTRWIGAESDKAWRAVEARYKFITGSPPDRSNPRAVLRALIGGAMSDPSARWTGVAAHGPGVRIEFARVRGVGEASVGLISGVDSIAYWYGAPALNALRLRVAHRTIEQAAGDGNGLTIAEARIIVRREDGARSAWHTSWYWDSRSGLWCNTNRD